MGTEANKSMSSDSLTAAFHGDFTRMRLRRRGSGDRGTCWPGGHVCVCACVCMCTCVSLGRTQGVSGVTEEAARCVDGQSPVFQALLGEAQHRGLWPSTRPPQWQRGVPWSFTSPSPPAQKLQIDTDGLVGSEGGGSWLEPVWWEGPSSAVGWPGLARDADTDEPCDKGQAITPLWASGCPSEEQPL